MKIFIHLFLLMLFFLAGPPVKAQLSLEGQLRTRTEVLHGQGAPLPKGSPAAFFTSQRTRLNVGYSQNRLTLKTVVQDVRIWGQDASTNNRISPGTNNGLMLHEAWAEIDLLDSSHTQQGKAIKLKIGRQELLYDDSRLLGNLDWLQQGRRHDAAILKFQIPNLSLHIGAAYNQNRESKSGTLYDGVPVGYPAGTNGIGTMYKSMQYAYINKKTGRGNLSFLFFKDDFQKYSLSETGVKIGENGTWKRITLGPYLHTKVGKVWDIQASAYLQTGQDPAGRNIAAYMYTLKATAQLNESVSLGPGFDLSSGGTGSKNKSFDPLYGTPHKFWGQMDYYYTASSFGQGGLADLYLHSHLKLSNKLNLQASLHHFSSASALSTEDGNPASRNLGSEVDLIAQYNLSPTIGFQAGYSHYFSTNSLARLKGITNAQKQADWAYLMINIQPNFLR
ncbi:alginate export protein [Dyadobacter jejuensis]|uniref:Alginate export protein n=1 Tax=Dyadobacter jejuensis TaxID=1082580 RepID=A0A316ATJ8_9BACT|nr:alginate export family protein [Dyadobacter jejuensis]PWJ60609.1 alginate export protein [Dyadobacter jejuensis]